LNPLAAKIVESVPLVGIVALVGEHDASSATRIENELAVLLDTGVAIVVDLMGATFIDSRMLSVLLTARQQANSAGLGFTLALPDDPKRTQVHRILEITGLWSVFAIYPTLSDALAGARAGERTGDRISL
jgi:anti-anti-sigma factor